MAHITHATKPISAKNINRNWHLINISGQVLGRSANEIATLLQGKHKVNYSANIDMGDFVVVINAKDVAVTGKKESQKKYTYYSGYPDGLRVETLKDLMKKNPTEVIRHAVVGMLPKNKLRDRRMARLFIFSEDKHPYDEQVKSTK